MKRILIATVLSFAAAGSVSAMTSSPSLSTVAAAQAHQILPNASFDNLSANQVARIEGLLSGGKDMLDTELRQLLNTALES
ncbi:hypothetical protein [Pseudorhodobacter aquimaris]|uniref:hypothetical protein n=1 Tax=Pseudorhodobacter aquimaris TaxID=687412 RepID=UPI00067D45E5|nr:hypothetical protein [Pseudorhodobacter aquimaris]